MAAELAIGLMAWMVEGRQEKLQAVRDLGIDTIQLQYPPHLDSKAGVAHILESARQTEVEITTVFCGFPGESYADIPTVRATVGLVPDNTRQERVQLIDTISRFAQQLGVNRVADHIGFIPENPNDPRYKMIVDTVQGVCDLLATRGQNFALETGQETAHTLRCFIGDVHRPNLSVNFDPANMILYGNDNPVAAMDLLGPHIDGVHCKDGCWPTQPNQLGEEKILGEGDVNIPLWLEKLLQSGYRGPLTIEREISGEAQRQDILKAKTLLEKLLQQLR